MCTVLLPPGDNPIAVDKYIKLGSFCRGTEQLHCLFELLKLVLYLFFVAGLHA